jgi:hypothetical protein
MNLTDLQLLRRNGSYWEANADYLSLLKDMAFRGRMSGELNASYTVPPGADVRDTYRLFLL